MFYLKRKIDLVIKTESTCPFDFVYVCHPMQADGFAKKLGYASGLRGGLVKLQVTFYYTYCKFCFYMFLKMKISGQTCVSLIVRTQKSYYADLFPINY